METPSDFMNFVKEQNIRMVALRFVDLYGHWHTLTIPASKVNDELFTMGEPFDGSSIPGFKTTEAGDMVLLPDVETVVRDPFAEFPTLSVICTVAEADTREPFVRDPRGIAAKAEKALSSLGIGDSASWSPEFEFYVFDRVLYENSVNKCGFHIESPEGFWHRHLDAADKDTGFGEYPLKQGGYHQTTPMDRLFDLRSEICEFGEDAGIDVHYHHHEVGGPGQCEIEIEFLNTVKAGDAVLYLKYLTRNVAASRGLLATFMPKPMYNVAGSGMHFHQHLFNGDKPLFWDYEQKNYADLSDLALYYIGGLLKHGPALLAFTNPSTNSYRRLVPGFEAPVKSFFSLGNRSAAVRVPKYATTPESKRMEFRPPDASCNPYLAMAAQLMAGIDGIVNKFDPREHGYGPFDVDVFKLPKEERDKIHSLPTDLSEAIQALREDHEFLLREGVFSADMINSYCEHLFQKEVQPIKGMPHPFEFERSLHC
ncbi:MAG: type I glutamate--ammonia ligase [Planctomycetota bacterium]|nr:type I glutamate--ammonia ligase [Planctomycetota bacterium]